MGNFYLTQINRLYESKRLKFQKYREKYKNSTDIKSLEQQLNDTNGKSCDIEKFSEYINKRNKILDELVDKYKNSQFRRLKWYGYLNTKRSEDRLLNRIEAVYGKDVNIIIGDWSIGHHMKNFISTPMIGLKRKLKSRFKMFNIDEYRTSMIHHEREIEMENLYLKDKKGEYRKQHSILTYQMENKRLGCINRDKNSCKNMLKIVNHWKDYRTRPKILDRKKETNQ